MTSQVTLNVGPSGRVLLMTLIMFSSGRNFAVGADTVNEVLSSFSSLSSSASDDTQVITESDDVIVTSSSSVPSSVDLSSSNGESSSVSSGTPYVPGVSHETNSSSASSDLSSLDSSESSQPQEYSSDYESSMISSSSADYHVVEWRNKGPHKSAQRGQGGRPPAVFEAPPKQGSNPASTKDEHGKRIVPDGDVENERGSGKPAPQDSKESSSKKPGRQWGGPPTPHRLRELRTGDTKYLDLYLCGQFLPGSANASADDFAVISFNYAGRTQPYSPCTKLGSTPDTVNYIYHTRVADKSAFQQVLDNLPETWKRQVSTQRGDPRVVHLFTFHLPASIADLSRFLRLRSSPPYRSARFVLGYVNIESPGESNSPRDFLDVLHALKRAKIDVIRVCGRCAKVASYPSGGRRRRAMAYGMSVLSDEPRNSECRPIQELDVPGADLSSDVCDSFQKSVIRCALRGLQRRCPKADVSSLSSDNDEALFQSVNDMIRTCDVDAECWRREAESIRELIEPNTREQCNMPSVAIGKTFGKCAASAAGIPPEP